MEQKGINALFVIGTLGLIIAIVAALTQTPQVPISGKAINVGAAPQGYASPHDVDDSNREIMALSVTPNGDDFSASVTVDTQGGYVYEKGYYLSEGQWIEFTFAGASDGWVDNSASHTITDQYINHVLTTTDEELVVAAYTCKQYTGTWRCGCSGASCDLWMLQSEDLGSGETSGTYLEVSPARTEVTDNEQFSVDVMLRGGSDVYAYDFDLEFDSSVVTFESLTYGDYLGTNGYPPETTDPDFLCVDYTEESDALRGVACTHVGTDLSNGDGTLVTLNFRANSGLTDGYSQFRISASEIATWPDVATQGTQPSIADYGTNNGYVAVE